MSAYTYLNSVVSDPNVQKVAVAGVLAAGMLVTSKMASSKIVAATDTKELVIPDKKFNLFGFYDVLVSGFVSFHDSILGKENRKYLSLSGSVFFFIFFSNLLGLIPGMPAITTTVWINVAIALVVFIAFNYYGIKEQGAFNYLKHFTGGLTSGFMIIIGLFVLFLELLSTCLRVLTLNLRLYWNISADHLVLGTFMDLVPVAPIFFYLMGTFVAFMQAFVFTTLTMIYILLATQHSEDH